MESIRYVTLADNRATRRRAKLWGKGTQKPNDLGIKQYKREHGNEPKRVLYYKLEMWKAFHELKEKTHGEKSEPKEQRISTKRKRAKA